MPVGPAQLITGRPTSRGSLGGARGWAWPPLGRANGSGFPAGLGPPSQADSCSRSFSESGIFVRGGKSRRYEAHREAQNDVKGKQITTLQRSQRGPKVTSRRGKSRRYEAHKEAQTLSRKHQFAKIGSDKIDQKRVWYMQNRKLWHRKSAVFSGEESANREDMKPRTKVGPQRGHGRTTSGGSQSRRYDAHREAQK